MHHILHSVITKCMSMHAVHWTRQINTFSCQENRWYVTYIGNCHIFSQRRPWDHTKLDFIVTECPDKTGSLLKPRVPCAMHLSAGTRASFACLSIITTHCTARTSATKKKQIPHWPVTRGTKVLPCMHTEEIQTEFMTALSLLFPSPLHPPVDTRSHHTGADRPGITHSLAS